MKKLTAKEREAIEIMRQLDVAQRDKNIERMRRELLANQITARVGKVRKLRIVNDTRVEGTFGVPKPKQPRPKRRR